MVDARSAGRGRLTGKLTGVNYHTDVEVKDLGDGRYACHYLVPQAGAYVLSLMWNGQHIPESPYKVTVREAQAMKANKCVVEGTKTGKKCSLNVTLILRILVAVLADRLSVIIKTESFDNTMLGF